MKTLFNGVRCAIIGILLMCMAAAVHAQSAKAFLDKLQGATPVANEDNKAGLFIESITKSGNDYIVNWMCTNRMIADNQSNQMYLMSKIYFIDPEDYTNNYQPFSINKDGKLDLKYETGDPIGPVRRIKFSTPSKVLYMYFTGVEKGNGNPAELYTVPLFFTIVLGDKPYVFEKTPRRANKLFDNAIKKK